MNEPQRVRLPSENSSSTEPSMESDASSQLPPSEPHTFLLPIPSKEILPQDQHNWYLKKKELEYSENNSLILNSENIKLLCMKEGLYEFPELNNKLYLHFKCIEKIQNLGEYINLKTLYLENNVIRKIENLGQLTQLENLFLQHNMIEEITGLENNKNLRVLNLSYNNIFNISGLSELQHLQNLTITNNYLEKFDSVSHLGECSQELTSIDLSHNKIVANPRLFDIVTQVKCLYLNGNPLVREIEHYRRTVIGKLKCLMYLDMRAVGDDERLMAEKWIEEGNEGLKKAKAILEERQNQRKEEQKKEVMKDINMHRTKKINMFNTSISELKEEISKLESYKQDPANQNMEYYYNSSIEEKHNKINELQGFIQSLVCRIEGKEHKKVESSKLIEGERLERICIEEVVEENPEPKQATYEDRENKINKVELRKEECKPSNVFNPISTPSSYDDLD